MFDTDYELYDVRDVSHPDTLPVSSNDRITLPCPSSDTLPAPKRTWSEKRRLAHNIRQVRKEIKKLQKILKARQLLVQLENQLDDMCWVLSHPTLF
jgi:hypothetical protein